MELCSSFLSCIERIKAPLRVTAMPFSNLMPFRNTCIRCSEWRKLTPSLAVLNRNWYYKGQGSKYIPDVALVEARAREARVFLRELAQSGPDDAHIVVVSHGGFLHFLTENYSGLTEKCFTTYGNTTIRSFQFVDLYGTDPDAKMVETEESFQKSKLPRFTDMSDDEKELCKSHAVARIELQKRDFENATRCNRPPVRTHVF
ncbi:hypothetical protein F4824DRAFT_84381 [Ustulina deusta]|nr:hypothetical protein F4824DRAFT_84381 [Ustulina deusta]